MNAENESFSETLLDFSKEFEDLYVVERPLGSGAFSTVVQALDRATGERLAVKVSSLVAICFEQVYECSSEGFSKKIIEAESETVRRLKHKNVIGFKHVKTKFH
jgi:serine/threonine protein kinase